MTALSISSPFLLGRQRIDVNFTTDLPVGEYQVVISVVVADPSEIFRIDDILTYEVSCDKREGM